ncbi:MAG: hypothetical protein HFF16_08150 [Angelakisella sp.]|jgi:lysophospholipase L1-like esterase|nr:hypothetical protein [Angelakisella sp.]MCI9529653.1 hypothetical protein [Angelakisella sp.]
MKKRRSPVYHSRRRGSGLRSFFVTLLGAAAIAVLGAGVWQLLDPVEYQPPLTPFTAANLAAASSSAGSGAPPPEGAQQDQTEPPASTSEPAAEEPPKDPTQVEEGAWLASEYFDDALFVGDSITEGIKLYDVMNNATVLSNVGVNLNNLYTKEVIEAADGRKIPIMEASANYNPGKIYLLMGINSIADDEESFRAAYGRVVDTLITQHPDAIVYIQSILPVTAAYEARPNAVADNAKIDRYNAIIKELAAEKGVYYLNVAEIFKDADGCLYASASPKDGIHFGSAWYRKWFDYLRTHGVEESPDENQA